jgi:chromosome partitioning protein
MKGKVIAVANMKGGVGKTATVIGLAEALAADDPGARILVIDLDAQANASIVLAGDQYLAELIRNGKTIDGFLEDHLMKQRRIGFDDCVRDQISDVSHGGRQLSISVLASSPELRSLELKLIYTLTKRKFDLDAIVNRFWDLMRDQLKQSKKRFDYVLIDCAPGISTLTEASIRLANLVIVPTIPDSLSTYGLQAFCNSIWHGQLAVASSFKKPKRRFPYVLVTRRRPIREHDATIERLRYELQAPDPAFAMFDTEIPERASIAEALGKTGTFPSFSNKWGIEVTSIMSDLVRETKEALDATRH